jgi:hypothetical protein
MEILNILGSWDESGKRNPLAKAASPQRTETVEGSQVVGAWCQEMSKAKLTLVEAPDKPPDLTVEAEYRRRSTNQVRRARVSL